MKGSTKFKVGDKVWDMQYGWGDVKEINHHPCFKIKVKFNNCSRSYAEDGKLHIDSNRTLFFEEIPIPESALIREKRWRADENGVYYHVNSYGEIDREKEDMDDIDNKRWNVGNYFSTREEAKESRFYKMFEEKKE